MLLLRRCLHTGGLQGTLSNRCLHTGGPQGSLSSRCLHTGGPQGSLSSRCLHTGGPQGSLSSRCLHTGGPHGSQSKSNLAKLRKRTGISFNHCKKALIKFDQDLTKAEAWLLEQAQKEGWTKATKLKDRITAQGLIGLAYDNHYAAMVEVNCETDFVARNDMFQNFVGQVAAATLRNYRKDYEQLLNPVKFSIAGDDLKPVQAIDGSKSLDDLMAFTIGQVKENMALRRAMCMFAPEGHHIGYYVHSPVANMKQSDSICMLGKYGALVTFQQTTESADKKEINTKDFGRRLGQHIVGMNPVTIGEYTRPPLQSEVETQEPEETVEESKGFSDSEEDKQFPPEEELPTEMLKQEYLLDASICVGEHLLQSNVSLVDFARYECGESLSEEGTS